MTEYTDTKSVLIRNVPEKLWSEAKALAALRGVKLQTIVITALAEYIDRQVGGGEVKIRKTEEINKIISTAGPWVETHEPLSDQDKAAQDHQMRVHYITERELKKSNTNLSPDIAVKPRPQVGPPGRPKIGPGVAESAADPSGGK